MLLTWKCRTFYRQNFETLHAFVPLTFAKLSTLKSSLCFFAHPVCQTIEAALTTCVTSFYVINICDHSMYRPVLILVTLRVGCILLLYYCTIQPIMTVVMKWVVQVIGPWMTDVQWVTLLSVCLSVCLILPAAVMQSTSWTERRPQGNYSRDSCGFHSVFALTNRVVVVVGHFALILLNLTDSTSTVEHQ